MEFDCSCFAECVFALLTMILGNGMHRVVIMNTLFSGYPMFWLKRNYFAPVCAGGSLTSGRVVAAVSGAESGRRCRTRRPASRGCSTRWPPKHSWRPNKFSGSTSYILRSPGRKGDFAGFHLQRVPWCKFYFHFYFWSLLRILFGFHSSYFPSPCEFLDCSCEFYKKTKRPTRRMLKLPESGNISHGAISHKNQLSICPYLCLNPSFSASTPRGRYISKKARHKNILL